MTAQTHPDDALAAFALEALPDDERKAVATHLAQCARCRHAVAEFQSVGNAVALTAPPLAAHGGLRARILTEAAATPQYLAQSKKGRGRILPWLTGWVAAAALFILSLGLGSIDVALQQQSGVSAPQPTFAVALAATTDAAGASGSVTVAATQTALSVQHLPPPPPGYVYEAWVIAGASPLPAGTFITTPDGHADLALTQAAVQGSTVAITTEPAPSQPKPTGKVLLKGIIQPAQGS